MVKITDITAQESERKNLLEKKIKFLEKHFPIGLPTSAGSFVQIYHGANLLLSFMDTNPAIMTVYSSKIIMEELLRFGKEYEKMFGKIEIKTDYSSERS